MTSKPHSQHAGPSPRLAMVPNSGDATASVYQNRKKGSTDARHTGPKKRAKTGGWPSIPPSKSFTLWVPNEHEEKLRQLATSKGCSVATLIRHAISEVLKNGVHNAEVPRGSKARSVRALREEVAPAIRKK